MGLFKPRRRRIDLSTLLLLSVATSIDALGVGLSFAFLKVSIIIPIAAIGIVTFASSFLGAAISDKLGKTFSNKIEVLGGLIMIGV